MMPSSVVVGYPHFGGPWASWPRRPWLEIMII